MGCRGMGLEVGSGLPKIWRARGMAASRQEVLPGIPGPISAVSSMYTSHLPSSVGIFTIVSFVEANGMCAGRGVGGGNLFCDGECVVDGSHSAQVRMSFVRLVTGSEMHPHSLGHCLPPKVRWRAMRRKMQLSMMTCVRDFTADLALKC